jgi:signal transduction histidine kinase/DNA-binding NarL/FixJ family response regulator
MHRYLEPVSRLKKPFSKSRIDLKTLYHHRTLSNPTEGNRTTLNVTICVILLSSILVSLFFHEYTSLIRGHVTPPPGGFVASHVLALLVTLFFLLIDGSPETLGLGLCLSCDSLARSIDFSLSNPEYFIWLKSGLLFLGDVFRLYFASQLSRIAAKHLQPWFVWGGLTALVYGLLMQFSQTFRAEFSYFIDTQRTVIVSILSSWLCFRVAKVLLSENIPWRVFALVLAGISFLDVPLTLVVEILSDGQITQSTLIALRMYQVATMYLLTISAFINVSPMENRVKAISSAKTEAHILRLTEEQKINTAIAKTTQMLAHDIRKPFSLIKAYADSLIATGNPDDARKIIGRMIVDVQRSLKTVDQLISDIMDIGRPIPSKLQPTEVQAVISQSIDRVFKISSRSDIRFRYSLRHTGSIMADEQQLVRVIANILENAEQAIGGKPETITFTTFNDSGRKGDWISLEVHNTGSHIERTDIKHLFEAFFTKGKKGGTGLGLAIVRKIIQEHGGTIYVTSDPSSGTSFRFHLKRGQAVSSSGIMLPKHSSHVRMQFEISKPDETENKRGHDTAVSNGTMTGPAESSTANPLRVLIVDDEKAYADGVLVLLQPLLHGTGMVQVASTGAAALQLLEKQAYSLLICDFDLKSPHIDGLDVITSAKQSSPECYTILHTNHVFRNDTDATRMRNVDVHLSKPARDVDLKEAIAKALRPANQRGRYTVAIVEDDLIFAENLQAKLPDYRTTHFFDPKEFCQNLENNPKFVRECLVVITDLYFSGFSQSGHDVAVACQKVGIPVFLYSNAQEEGQKHFRGHLKKDLSNLHEIEQEFKKLA